MDSAPRLLFRPYILDIANEQLWRDQELVSLRSKPFALLRHLAENPGRLVTHEELRKVIWPQIHVSHGALREHLREVRIALGDDADAPQFIETVPRRGYRFLAKVQQEALAPAARNVVPTVARPKGSKIVGRDSNLSRLQALLDAAATGHGRVVLISGEAGIGKSALLETFLAIAAASCDPLIGRGQCVEQRGEAEPYLPVLEALQEICGAPPNEELIEIMRKQAPTWLVQLPGLIDKAALEQFQQSVLGTGRARMLREIAQALGQISARRLVILALEDLQWSDPSTLTLIDLLARQSEGARLLIVGTHRPAATLSASHPLQALLRELIGHGCEPVALEALTLADVEQYLHERIEPSLAHDSVSMRRVARSVHQRTEGNPLFMTAVVETLLRGEDQESFRDRVDHVDRIAPENLLQAIIQQFILLSPDEQRLLETAGVAGISFSAAVLAAAHQLPLAEVEEQCAALAQRMSFLQEAGEVEWPDGTVAARFRFRHALFWEVVYQRVMATRRALLHQRVGEREEIGFGQRCHEISAELAHHFERARDFPRTLKYREQAAQLALHRCAPQEALDHITAGLSTLEHLDNDLERTACELRLRLLQGTALQASRGYGAAEVREAYERASELCRGVGETPQLFSSLMGIWAFTAGRGEWQRARELAERSHRLAESIGQAPLLARSWRAKGQVAVFSGEFERAREDLERAVNLSSEKKLNPLDPNTAVDARCVLAWDLEILGLADQALAVMRKAVAVAEQSQSAFDITYSTFFGAVFYSMRKEWKTAESWSRRLSAMAEEHGLPYFQLMGTHQLGVAMIGAGQPEAGLPLMRNAVAACQVIGVETGLTGMQMRVAEASLLIGDSDAGLDAIDQAMAAIDKTSEHLWEAELQRIKGNLLVQRFHQQKGKTSTDTYAAEGCYVAALELARQQGARKWELRASLALANVWKERRRKNEAREVLLEARRRFTEGLGSADIVEADHFLAQL